MRRSIAMAGAAALVAALLLGGWFRLSDREPTAAGTGSPGVDKPGATDRAAAAGRSVRPAAADPGDRHRLRVR
jgi:hypothetical protein